MTDVQRAQRYVQGVLFAIARRVPCAPVVGDGIRRVLSQIFSARRTRGSVAVIAGWKVQWTREMPVGRRDGVPSVVATRWYSRIIIPCWRQASRSSEPARIRTTAQTGSDTRRHGSVKTRAAIIESFRSDDTKRFAAISSRRLSRNRFFGVPIAALSPSRSRSDERHIHIGASVMQLVGQ